MQTQYISRERKILKLHLILRNLTCTLYVWNVTFHNASSTFNTSEPCLTPDFVSSSFTQKVIVFSCLQNKLLVWRSRGSAVHIYGFSL
ncbi:hypothetical protein HOLleu_15709 [Holothuria leucospilota]|uniref:Uncharacterized protein n=1 Tax=Holothuria leucospilota TaxID=206669 RepID=A0A9Q1C448_HOLLE|nr:hypothetical protein HOLleu_15709 [Holothuria leucospilota]